MKGDFTRWTFDPKKPYTRVLLQQGRVQLDADWNEQASIHLHLLRTLVEDLVGPFGGTPAKADGTIGDGFRLDTVKGDKNKDVPKAYRILGGRFYAGGLVLENPPEGRTFKEQPEGIQLLYVDAWERLVTYVQDDLLREAALGGVDTAARAQVEWQVRSLPLKDRMEKDKARSYWLKTIDGLRSENRGQLTAQAKKGKGGDDEPCIVSPQARYTGENQLYRLEIHKGGKASEGATFKWSRENGSVVFPISDLNSMTLEHRGRDGRFTLQKDDWVEALDDSLDEQGQPGALLQVTEVDPDRSRVTLSAAVTLNGKHPYLRRWDQRGKEGAVPIQEGTPVELENGINITFEATDSNGKAVDHTYRVGDYWLIPARTATGDVEWPGEPDKPKAVEPHGVEHRYGLLGMVAITGNTVEILDYRASFKAWT